ncbi:hypothetical protein [Sandaracinus amylolyticus]|nr:hypothetical protein [Sandaracinus amylolyticus]
MTVEPSLEWIDLHDSVLAALHFDARTRDVLMQFDDARAHRVGDPSTVDCHVDLLVRATRVTNLIIFEVAEPDYVTFGHITRAGADVPVLDLVHHEAQSIGVDLRFVPAAALAFQADALSAAIRTKARAAPTRSDGGVSVPESASGTDLRLPRTWPDAARLLELGFEARETGDEVVVRFGEVADAAQRCVELRGVGLERLQAYRLDASRDITRINIQSASGEHVDLRSFPRSGLRSPTVTMYLGHGEGLFTWRPRELAMRILPSGEKLPPLFDASR